MSESKQAAFKPKKSDEKAVHIKITKSITVNKQEIEVEKKMQKMKPKAFKSFVAQAKNLGYKIQVIYSPLSDEETKKILETYEPKKEKK